MPKIIIREDDATSAGIGLYTNFSVLVPGFVKNTEAFEAAADDNDVYEVSTKKDFIEKIGKVSPGNAIVSPAIAPQPRDKEQTISTSDSFAAFWSDAEGDKCLMFKDTTSTPEGESVPKKVTAAENFLQALTFLSTAEAATVKLYERTPKASDKTIGELVDDTYEYVRLPSNDPEEYNTSDEKDPRYIFIHDQAFSSKKFVLIQDTKIGANENNIEHYGNQIAYELVKLGYTVLFKKMNVFGDLVSDTFWAPLKDRSVYDFRYIINGVIKNNTEANKAIIKLASCIKGSEDDENSGRGDCTALCDIDANLYEGKAQSAAISCIQSDKLTDSTYAAYFAPFVTYNLTPDSEFADNMTFPASFHYLACAAKAAENYNEWYAVAGYTRGVSSYSINSIGCKFGEEAVQALEPRYQKNGLKVAVNLIIKVKNNYYLWGNRTAHQLGVQNNDNGDLVASHFLNIRQLCSSIKKQVYISCRKFTFDPNSDILWINFCNAIRPLLEKMKGDQGIQDYKFIKVKTAKKATLKAIIRIIPIEAVEDFDISLTLEDSFSGIVTGISE